MPSLWSTRLATDSSGSMWQECSERAGGGSTPASILCSAAAGFLSWVVAFMMCTLRALHGHKQRWSGYHPLALEARTLIEGAQLRSLCARTCCAASLIRHCPHAERHRDQKHAHEQIRATGRFLVHVCPGTTASAWQLQCRGKTTEHMVRCPSRNTRSAARHCPLLLQEVDKCFQILLRHCTVCGHLQQCSIHTGHGMC